MVASFRQVALVKVEEVPVSQVCLMAGDHPALLEVLRDLVEGCTCSALERTDFCGGQRGQVLFRSRRSKSSLLPFIAHCGDQRSRIRRGKRHRAPKACKFVEVGGGHRSTGFPSGWR